MLQKELEKKKIPLIVYGSTNEVRKLLQETLKSSLIEVTNDDELEVLLQELSPADGAGKHELREVVTPLLSPDRAPPIAELEDS